MGTRHRIVLVGLVLLAPTALAQSLPGIPDVPSPALPGIPSVESLDIDEGPFRFYGSPADPSLIEVRDPDGEPALTYTLHADGKASLRVGDAVAMDDLTLLRVDGSPLEPTFTFVVRDPRGGDHAVTIDRAALLLALPELPPIQVLGDATWPGAPAAPYLLYVADERPNHLAAAALDGTSFLRLSGGHTALVQMPMDQKPFDHITLQATRARSGGADVANGAAVSVPFMAVPTTTDAMVYRALYEPGRLSGVLSGDEVELRVVYERRATPLIVERFAESQAYSYRLDGDGPSVAIRAPSTSNDFRVPIAWEGSDPLTGVKGFSVDYRHYGDASWTRWIDGGSAESAVFSGEWGRSYEFRVHSLDGVGNPSAAPATAVVSILVKPSTTDDVNDPPHARILAPAAGSALAGEAIVEWIAEDPDATPVTSKLEVSANDGETWRTLYVGTGTSFGWLTSAELDGAAYRLRLTVSDGTAQAFDAVSGLAVRNVKLLSETAPASGGSATPPGSANGATTDAGGAGGAEDEGGKGVPAPSVLLGLLALAGIALLARRRD